MTPRPGTGFPVQNDPRQNEPSTDPQATAADDGEAARCREAAATPWREHLPAGLMSTLGPLLSRRETGGWAYGLRVDARHLNQAGIVHGGTIAALIDQALSMIAWEQAGQTPCLTVQLNMSFLRAAQSSQMLVARGTITHSGGSMFFLDGTVHADDTLVATAQAVMKRRPAR